MALDLNKKISTRDWMKMIEYMNKFSNPWTLAETCKNPDKLINRYRIAKMLGWDGCVKSFGSQLKSLDILTPNELVQLSQQEEIIPEDIQAIIDDLCENDIKGGVAKHFSNDEGDYMPQDIRTCLINHPVIISYEATKNDGPYSCRHWEGKVLLHTLKGDYVLSYHNLYNDRHHRYGPGRVSYEFQIRTLEDNKFFYSDAASTMKERINYLTRALNKLLQQINESKRFRYLTEAKSSGQISTRDWMKMIEYMNKFSDPMTLASTCKNPDKLINRYRIAKKLDWNECIKSFSSLLLDNNILTPREFVHMAQQEVVIPEEIQVIINDLCENDPKGGVAQHFKNVKNGCIIPADIRKCLIEHPAVMSYELDADGWWNNNDILLHTVKGDYYLKVLQGKCYYENYFELYKADDHSMYAMYGRRYSFNTIKEKRAALSQTLDQLLLDKNNDTQINESKQFRYLTEAKSSGQISTRDWMKMIEYMNKFSNPQALANTCKNAEKLVNRYLIAKMLGWDACERSFKNQIRYTDAINSSELEALDQQYTEGDIPEDIKAIIDDLCENDPKGGVAQHFKNVKTGRIPGDIRKCLVEHPGVITYELITDPTGADIILLHTVKGDYCLTTGINYYWKSYYFSLYKADDDDSDHGTWRYDSVKQRSAALTRKLDQFLLGE